MSSHESAHSSAPRPRLVWAEDNDDMRAYVTRLLCKHFEVEATSDGLAALAAARARPPDLLLADVRMPRLDGVDLVRVVRADPRLREVPVILLSAQSCEEACLAGLTEGADDYLVKPVSPRELIARIEVHVRMARLRREAAARLRRMINIDGVGVLLFALPEGRLVDANDYFLRMFGYERGDLESTVVTWRTITPPEYVAVSEAQLARFAETGRIGPYEKEYLRKDGSRAWMVFAGASLGDGTVVEYCIDISDRKRAEAELREAHAELERRVDERTAELAAALRELEVEMASRRTLARRLARAQEDERRRVARDLHDSVGQLLTGLALSLRAAEAVDALPPPAAAGLVDAQRLVDALVSEVHSIAVRLRPTALDDLGLSAALDALVSEWSSRTGVDIDFEAAGLGRLPADVETALYRIIQEALTNVGRHARATVVSVVVTVVDGHATVVVEDNGVGFRPEDVPTSRLGLVGMRERVAQVGGRLEIDSRPRCGTSLFARIPLVEAPPGATDRRSDRPLDD